MEENARREIYRETCSECQMNRYIWKDTEKKINKRNKKERIKKGEL